MMTLEVQTVIMLRARITALQSETPLTVAGRAMRDAAIADLEGCILAVRNGVLSSPAATISIGLL